MSGYITYKSPINNAVVKRVANDVLGQEGLHKNGFKKYISMSTECDILPLTQRFQEQVPQKEGGSGRMVGGIRPRTFLLPGNTTYPAINMSIAMRDPVGGSRSTMSTMQPRPDMTVSRIFKSENPPISNKNAAGRSGGGFSAGGFSAGNMSAGNWVDDLKSIGHELIPMVAPIIKDLIVKKVAGKRGRPRKVGAGASGGVAPISTVVLVPKKAKGGKRGRPSKKSGAGLVDDLAKGLREGADILKPVLIDALTDIVKKGRGRPKKGGSLVGIQPGIQVTAPANVETGGAIVVTHPIVGHGSYGGKKPRAKKGGKFNWGEFANGVANGFTGTLKEVGLPVLKEVGPLLLKGAIMGAGVKKPRAKKGGNWDWGEFANGVANGATGTLKEVGLPVLRAIAMGAGVEKKKRGGKVKFSLPNELNSVAQAPIEAKVGGGASAGKVKREMSSKMKSRMALVKKIMSEKGMKMIEASKFIKTNNLEY